MTIAEQIIEGVASLISERDCEVFTRQEIREVLGVDLEIWNASYNPIFQSMRADQAGRAPGVREEYKNLFHQVEYGKHTLTDYGNEVIRKWKSG